MVTTDADVDGIPTYQELMNPMLDALRELGGSATNAEATNQMIRALNLPSESVEQPHSGKANMTELGYRLTWTRDYLKQYGLLKNSARGVWSLTTKGREAERVVPEDVARHVRQLKRTRKQGKRLDSEPDIVPTIDEIDGDLADEENDWREHLISALLDMSPDAFERLCQLLLRESGFIEVVVTGKSGDGGIDGHGIIRFAGLISFPVLFQCKRYSGNVDVREVRNFRGTMQGRADRGLILTTGNFTQSALREATRDGAPPIDLIDGEALMDKLKELRLGVNVEMVESVEVDSDWFNAI